jgi:hypothetical protein
MGNPRGSVAIKFLTEETVEWSVDYLERMHEVFSNHGLLPAPRLGGWPTRDYFRNVLKGFDRRPSSPISPVVEFVYHVERAGCDDVAAKNDFEEWSLELYRTEIPAIAFRLLSRMCGKRSAAPKVEAELLNYLLSEGLADVVAVNPDTAVTGPTDSVYMWLKILRLPQLRRMHFDVQAAIEGGVARTKPLRQLLMGAFITAYGDIGIREVGVRGKERREFLRDADLHCLRIGTESFVQALAGLGISLRDWQRAV